MAEDRRIKTDVPDEQGAQDSVDTHARQDLGQQIRGLHIEIAELSAAVKRQTSAVVPVEAPVSQVAPTMTIDDLLRRDAFIKSVMTNFFQEGIHFGVPFPGSKDKMLYKVGAEWFASSFGVRPDYIPLDEVAEDGNVFYRYRCDLVFFHTGQVIGQAEGVCSSAEDKYKYRISNYKCPSCGEETIMKSRAEWGGGWYCNTKKGGCGAKYPKGEATIEHQPEPGRTLNTEVKALAHTISAMAQKRAFVLALKGAFGLGAYIKYFEGLDDLEDEPMIVDSSAKVKPDIPPRMAKHLETIKREATEPPAQHPRDGDEPPVSELDEYLGPRESKGSGQPANGDYHPANDETVFNSIAREKLVKWMAENYPPSGGSPDHANNTILLAFQEFEGDPAATWGTVFKAKRTMRAIWALVELHYAAKSEVKA